MQLVLQLLPAEAEQALGNDTAITGSRNFRNIRRSGLGCKVEIAELAMLFLSL